MLLPARPPSAALRCRAERAEHSRSARPTAVQKLRAHEVSDSTQVAIACSSQRRNTACESPPALVSQCHQQARHLRLQGRCGTLCCHITRLSLTTMHQCACSMPTVGRGRNSSEPTACSAAASFAVLPAGPVARMADAQLTTSWEQAVLTTSNVVSSCARKPFTAILAADETLHRGSAAGTCARRVCLRLYPAFCKARGVMGPPRAPSPSCYSVPHSLRMPPPTPLSWC